MGFEMIFGIVIARRGKCVDSNEAGKRGDAEGWTKGKRQKPKKKARRSEKRNQKKRQGTTSLRTNVVSAVAIFSPQR